MCQKARGSAFKTKPESLFEPDRSENARGIILETALVQDAKCPSLQIVPSTIGIIQSSKLLRVQLNRHGIDREIPAIEIFVQ